MAEAYRDIVQAAFSSQEWKTSANSIYQATGTSVSAMDFGEGTVLFSTGRCGFCHLATGTGDPGPETCFDVPPADDAEPCRLGCRAGLSAEIRPVVYEGRTVSHLVLAGFVTSTRERKRLYELMLVRGVREESARLALKTLPITPRRAVDGWADMAVAVADSALAAERGRRTTAEHTEDVSAVLGAARRILGATAGDPASLGQLLADASQITHARDAALLVASPDGRLEVVATHGGWPDPVGTHLDREGTLPGQAFVARRSVLSASEPGRRDVSVVALPIVAAERVLGVVQFGVDRKLLPLPSADAVRLERFMRILSVTLDRMAERADAARAASDSHLLDQLANAIGPCTDFDAIARHALRAVGDGFSFDVAALVTGAWDADRIDLLLNTDVSPADISALISDAAGPDAGSIGESALTVRGVGRLIEGAKQDGEWSTLFVEVDAEDVTAGTLVIASSSGVRYGAADRELLFGIAQRTAVALQRAALFSRVRDDYAKTIAALASSLETRHRPASTQGGRAMSFALMIAEELGVGPADTETLRFAALVHEIGLAGLPQEILLQPSSSSAASELRSHSEIGATVSAQIEFLKGVTPVILHHHERWDGTGYPAGLAGESIPPLARILGVADAFAEFTETSANGTRLTFRDARDAIEAAAGTQFDPVVVEAFAAALDRQATIGSIGVLAQPRDGDADRPTLHA